MHNERRFSVAQATYRYIRHMFVYGEYETTSDIKQRRDRITAMATDIGDRLSKPIELYTKDEHNAIRGN